MLSKPVAEEAVPKLVNVSAEALLRKILARVPSMSGATYLTRHDSIEITTRANVCEEQTSQVCFSPNGSRLASVEPDGTTRVWDAKTGQEVFRLAGGPESDMLMHSRQLRDRLVSPVQFAGFEADPRMSLQKALGMLAERYGLTFHVNEAAFRAEMVEDVLSKPVAEKAIPKMVNVSLDTVLRKLLSRVPSTSGTTYRIHRDSIEITTRAYAGQRQITHICFSPDGSRLATASWGGPVKVWDAKTGQERLTLEGSDRVTSVCFSPNGAHLASAAEAGRVRVWDVTTGKENLTLKWNTGTVTK